MAAARIRSIAAALVLLAPAALGAQRPDTSAFYRALDAEGAGRFRDAALLYRQALSSAGDRVNAMLGLERAYAEIGWTDSLLVPVDSLIRQYPRERVYRTIQLRAYTMLARPDDARRSFDRWVHDMPGASDPYQEYSRLLLERGQAAAADSIIRLAGANLGTTSSLQMELAESRAALGQWVPSATAWRGALAQMSDLDQATAFALTPAPDSAREAIRAIFLALPVDVGARRALAALEMNWGAPADAWAALRDLKPDSGSVQAWIDFAQAAEANEEWPLVRDALVAALRWRADPELALHAATAALNAGDPGTALALAPVGGLDSARTAATVLPLRVRALSSQGNPAQAEALIDRFTHVMSPLQRSALERSVALGWARVGDLDRARVALDSAGPDADSSDAAGWIALYQGNLAGARAILRNSTEASPQLAQAMALITRLRDDTATDVGRAFLALARLDSAGAAQAFVAAAPRHPDGAPAMLGLAAQIHAARRDTTGAVELWSAILARYPDAPEAPGAELAWARALRGAGQSDNAMRHLEHLILTYPESALVPQARRELELVRRAIPGGAAGGGWPS